MIRRTNVVFVVFILSFIQQATWSQSQNSELLLPPSTRAWLSISDIDGLVESVDRTSFGRMLNDEKIAPWVEDLSSQIRGWLDEKNVQFGLEIEDFEGVPSGEICVAGILMEPGAAAGDTKAKPDHATVLLVDVSDTKEEAKQLLEKIEANLGKTEAKKENLEFSGIDVSKWSIDKPRGLTGKVYAYHCIVGDWLVTCDNERIVKDIIKRVLAEKPNKANLANSPTFKKIQERCGFDTTDSHLRWFIEPFGYIELVQAVAEDRNPNAVESNDFAKIFREEGFDAIKGLGGTIRIFDGNHDLVHRTFVYAPPVPDAGEERFLRAAAMLDFSNTTGTDLTPPAWVPADAATYISLTFNLKKALSKIGYIVESLGAREGTWEKTLDQFRDVPDGDHIDIRKLVDQLENRISMFAATARPINEASERVVFGINIIGDEDIVKNHASKLILKLEKDGESSTLTHDGVEFWIKDTQVVEGEFSEDEFDLSALESLGNEDEPDAEEHEEEIAKPKPLFERRVGAVVNGVLLVGNDVEYMKKVVASVKSTEGSSSLAASDDYARIADSLNELSEEIDGNSLVRHFGRLDAALETNYEMMKQGKMGSSKTILAQILNQSINPESEGSPREQKINPEKMPQDYQADIAPYLGPNGMMVKATDEGWMIFGCVLPKKIAVATVAQKSSDDDIADDE